MDRHQWDMLSVAAERQRGRSRVRGTTAAVGLAGLTTAGVVAFTLPGPAHTAVTSGKAPASPASTPSSSSPSTGGDDGSSSTGSAGSGSSSSGSSSSSSAPANSVPTPVAAPPQVTSGGS